jgi:hypothetical protein
VLLPALSFQPDGPGRSGAPKKQSTGYTVIPHHRDCPGSWARLGRATWKYDKHIFAFVLSDGRLAFGGLSGCIAVPLTGHRGPRMRLS